MQPNLLATSVIATGGATGSKGKQTPDDVIESMRKRMQRSLEADGENRTRALDDLRFLAGEQWPALMAQLRTADDRPCLTINKLPTFLHQVTNDQRLNRPQIKVHPVDSNADPDTAKVIQGIVKHIEYNSNSDVAQDRAVNSAAACGIGFFRLLTDYESDESFDQEIRFASIRNPFTVYFDPLSKEPDGSDAKWCVLTDMVPRAEFLEQYPDADPVSGTALPRGLGDDEAFWANDDEVRVCEYYTIEQRPATLCRLSNGMTGFKDDLPKPLPPGVVITQERESVRRKVIWRKCTAVEVLEETEIACKWIPVFPVYGDEIDIDGKLFRSGLVRWAKDPQRMYNYWMHQSLDTPIATPDGWSTIGALKVGDTVFSDTGLPSKVIGKSPVYIGKDCYRVTFGDGTSVVSSAEHPWVVEERSKRTAAGFTWASRKCRTDELDPKRHCINVAGALVTPEVDLPIDPYVLGVWLGDGSRGAGVISASREDIEGMRSRIEGKGYSVAPARQLERSPCFTVLGLVTKLRELGVLNAKAIPAAYMRSSVKQRLELLRGLMDTDGNAHASGQCVFTQANEEFAAQFRELVVSLGIRTSVIRRAGRVSLLANGAPIVSAGATQICFTPPAGMAVFSMPRKLQMQMRERKRMPRRAQHKIISVERVDSVPVQCIGIDAPSHLYLCGTSMIPTHNTNATEEVALRTKSPYIGAEGQFEGYELDWRDANRRAIPFLQYKPTTIDGILVPPPQRQPMADIPSGMLQMAMHANDNIKATTGLFDSSIGARGSATSGVQERQQQQQGDVANFHYSDNLVRSIRHAGRCIIDMLPHYYDAPRVVRILGEDEKMDFAAVNQFQAEEGAIGNVLNNLTVGKYDVTVTSGPSYSTMRQEAADAMVQFGQSWPKLMDIAGDKVVRAMDWPGAEEIAERIKRTIPPELTAEEDEEGGMPPQIAAQLQQAQAVLAEQQKEADELTANAQKMDAAAQAEVNRVTGIKKDIDAAMARLEAFKREIDLDVQNKELELEIDRVKAEAANEKAIDQIRMLIAEHEMHVAQLLQPAAHEDGGKVAKAEMQEQERAEKEAQEAQRKDEAVSMVIQSHQDLMQAIGGIVEALQSRPRTMQVRAPSGDMYEGTIQ